MKNPMEYSLREIETIGLVESNNTLISMVTQIAGYLEQRGKRLREITIRSEAAAVEAAKKKAAHREKRIRAERNYEYDSVPCTMIGF